ncbi:MULTISPECIES: hypothetical protein [unclassified Exiguobacterium]|uniref:hypothetical protein n=1 Tax=unclassified Exiguobacterium TaxID=2644629 RepID=UPI001BE5D915|nr:MULTISPECIES: hypothetical protein [unclassified Exiguobacterium]
MKKFFDRLKQKLLDNKGLTSIELGLTGLITVYALAGFVDMVNMSQKLDTASSVSGYVGRVVGNQGGVMTQPSTHHLESYVTTPQLYREVKNTLAKGGFAEDDFTLEINGRTISPETSLPIIEFGERIPVTLTVRYEWDYLSDIVPGVVGGEKVSKRQVISSFKVRNGDIESGFEAGGD